MNYKEIIASFYAKKMKEKKLIISEWYSAETISGQDLEELIDALDKKEVSK